MLAFLSASRDSQRVSSWENICEANKGVSYAKPLAYVGSPNSFPKGKKVYIQRR